MEITAGQKSASERLPLFSPKPFPDHQNIRQLMFARAVANNRSERF
jgi:hypothetical protein